MFKGSMPALVTPFTDAGAVDEAAFAAHVEWQIAEGSTGLVPVGTTGNRRRCPMPNTNGLSNSVSRSPPSACR